MSSSEKSAKKPPLKTAICPLCGDPNLCALAANPNAKECWCEFVIFPDELLSKIPKDAVRKTCVCQKCLEEYRESINTADHTSSLK